MKEELVKLITEKLLINKEDLTLTELNIIDITLKLIEEKIEDLKITEETIKRLQIENSNLKAYKDDNFYHPEDFGEDEEDEYN